MLVNVDSIVLSIHHIYGDVTMAKSVKSAPRRSRSLELLGKETFHIGVDVHKRSYHVACWNASSGLLASWVQPASPILLIEKLRPFEQNCVRMVYEAGPTGFSLVRELRVAGFEAEVVAPSKLLVLPGPDSKSDRLDCKRLAMFSEKKLLTFVRVPTVQEEADRQVVRLREQLVRKSRSVQQQIKSFLLQFGIAEPAGLANWSKAGVAQLQEIDLCSELRFCLDVLLDEYHRTKEQLARIQREIRKLARHERHQDSIGVLQTVPGVGLITSIVFRTELIAPNRFRDGRQIARMIGLAPNIRESGETRHEGGIMRSGNGRLRSVLVEAAWRWVAGDAGAAQVYRRLVGNTGSAKKAIVAMARRLGILLWRMSVQQEPYRPQST